MHHRRCVLPEYHPFEPSPIAGFVAGFVLGLPFLCLLVMVFLALSK